MSKRGIVNLTWHDFNFYQYKWPTVVVKGKPWVRLEIYTSQNKVGVIDVDWLPLNVYRPIYNNVQALVDMYAPRKKHIIYLTSRVVCRSYPDRDDFYVPFKQTKDENWWKISKGIERNPWYLWDVARNF